MKRNAALVSLVAVLTLAGMPGALLAQTTPAAAHAAQEPGTLDSSGTAKVRRAPDFLTIRCGVSVEGKSAAEAQAAAMTTLAAAVKAVKELKLGEEYLQTDRVYLSPTYKNEGQYANSREVAGYRASMSLIIRTSELDAAPKVIDAALSSGCNGIESVEFGITEALAAREEAITLAAQAAKRKAQVLAGALGLKLGRIKHTDTSSQQGGWNANRFSNIAAQSVGGDDPASDSDDAFNPGMVEVWATVNVTYTIEE
ncbi:MAG: SIMPL domain-containing protein [Phycisphaerales bacterium]